MTEDTNKRSHFIRNIVIADLEFHHQPYAVSARHALRTAIHDWQALGYQPKVGIELEAYFFARDGDVQIVRQRTHDAGGEQWSPSLGDQDRLRGLLDPRRLQPPAYARPSQTLALDPGPRGDPAGQPPLAVRTPRIQPNAVLRALRAPLRALRVTLLLFPSATVPRRAKRAHSPDRRPPTAAR